MPFLSLFVFVGGGCGEPCGMGRFSGWFFSLPHSHCWTVVVERAARDEQKGLFQRGWMVHASNPCSGEGEAGVS